MADLRSTVDVLKKRKKMLEDLAQADSGTASVSKPKAAPSYTHETAPPEVRMTDEWLNEEMRRKKANK
ncbi:MAG: hypothetical protein AB1585_10625, partial [Thermodesulfobacteriota bacterium]